MITIAKKCILLACASGIALFAAESPKKLISLDEVMSKEIQDRTGVSKLSASERTALEEWVADFGLRIYQESLKQSSAAARPGVPSDATAKPTLKKRGQLTGVVQNATFVPGEQAGWVLSLGTTDSSDYVFVEYMVLLEKENLALLRGNPGAVMSLGEQYVGARVRVSGEVERDGQGRRFIRVAKREQIELL
jgi:hypothetical protein